MPKSLSTYESQRTLALKAAKAATCFLNCIDDSIELSPELLDLFGSNSEPLKSLSEAKRYIYRSDLGHLEQLLLHATSNQSEFRFEFRVKLQNLRHRWFVFVGEKSENEANPANSVIYDVIYDFTQQKSNLDAIRSIAAGVFNESKFGFYQNMTTNLAKLFRAKYCFIGKVVDNNKIQTIAVCKEGKVVDNINYPLEGSPCSEVVGNKVCTFVNGYLCVRLHPNS